MKKVLIKRILLIVAVLFSGLLLFNNHIQASSKYPDITTKFDVNKMSNYSEDDLFGNVTLKRFYVLGVSYDHVKQYRLVLVPKPTSNQYFYMTADKHKKVHVGQRITVKGQLNGRLQIPDDKWNKYFPSKALNENSTMVLVNSYK